MLRIQNPQAAAPDPSQQQGPDPQAAAGGPDPAALMQQLQAASQGAPDSQGQDKRYTVQKVDPVISGYMPSEAGPFECQRCTHFEGPSSCGIVAGDIDPQGCCNIFTPQDAGDSGGDDTGEAPPDPEAATEGQDEPVQGTPQAQS